MPKQLASRSFPNLNRAFGIVGDSPDLQWKPSQELAATVDVDRYDPAPQFGTTQLELLGGAGQFGTIEMVCPESWWLDFLYINVPQLLGFSTAGTEIAGLTPSALDEYALQRATPRLTIRRGTIVTSIPAMIINPFGQVGERFGQRGLFVGAGVFLTLQHQTANVNISFSMGWSEPGQLGTL